MEKIIEALHKLDVNNDNHWTADGLPKVETVKFTCGDLSVTREQIELALPGFNRASATLPSTVVTDEPVIDDVEVTSETYQVEDEIYDDDLAEELHQAEELLETMNLTIHAYISKRNEHEKIVNALREKVELLIGKVTSEMAIQSYLESQQRVLLERAAKIKMISESGITLKDLAEGLKSPLDVSMSRRKNRK